MHSHKKFIFEELPKSAVVNSTVHADDRDIDDMIINAVSQHLSSIVEESNNHHDAIKTSGVVKKIIDDSSEKYNLTNDDKADSDHVDLEAIKKEEYERGVRDTEGKYKPLLDGREADVNLSLLLHEKLSSIVPENGLDTEISKISAEAISGIAKKLHLVLPANFKEIITKGLLDKLNKFYKEGKITLTINPDRYDFCKEVLQSEEVPDIFKGNFDIVKDKNMSLDDCKLEWQDTKLEYNKQQLSSEIDKIVEQLKTAS